MLFNLFAREVRSRRQPCRLTVEELSPRRLLSDMGGTDPEPIPQPLPDVPPPPADTGGTGAEPPVDPPPAGAP